MNENEWVCSDCDRPIQIGDPVVVVIGGEMTDPNSDKPPFGLAVEGDAEDLFHSECWDGVV